MEPVKKDLAWLIKNANAKNLEYIIQAKKRKLEWSQEEIDKFLAPKISACQECVEHGETFCCGCNTLEMMLSDKPCGNGKF